MLVLLIFFGSECVYLSQLVKPYWEQIETKDGRNVSKPD
jgi:hypothetical protein